MALFIFPPNRLLVLQRTICRRDQGAEYVALRNSEQDFSISAKQLKLDKNLNLILITDMTFKITIITAGQSPRPHMIREITELLSDGVSVREIGVLDGLSELEILALEPGSGEVGIATVLQNGRNIAISESWLRYRILELCQNRGRSADDITVIASTGVFDLGTTGEYVLHAQNVLDQFLDTLLQSGLKIGKIYPLKGQIAERHKLNTKITGGFTPSGHPDQMTAAIQSLQDREILILTSLGYTAEDLEFARSVTEKPIIHARRIIAGALERKFRQSQSTSPGEKLLEGSALKSRLMELTQRERQVFDQVVDGLANKEIARQLGISYRTVEIHRSRMLGKMGASSSTDLMRMIVHNASQGNI